jgi:hypothetical protein
VVFPHPLGPTSPTFSAGYIFKSRRSKIDCDPNDICIPFNVTIGIETLYRIFAHPAKGGPDVEAILITPGPEYRVIQTGGADAYL